MVNCKQVGNVIRVSRAMKLVNGWRELTVPGPWDIPTSVYSIPLNRVERVEAIRSEAKIPQAAILFLDSSALISLVAEYKGVFKYFRTVLVRKCHYSAAYIPVRLQSSKAQLPDRAQLDEIQP